MRKRPSFCLIQHDLFFCLPLWSRTALVALNVASIEDKFFTGPIETKTPSLAFPSTVPNDIQLVVPTEYHSEILLAVPECPSHRCRSRVVILISVLPPLICTTSCERCEAVKFTFRNFGVPKDACLFFKLPTLVQFFTLSCFSARRSAARARPSSLHFSYL